MTSSRKLICFLLMIWLAFAPAQAAEPIKPAAEAADLEVIRADEERTGGIIHVPIGKSSFEPDAIVANVAALVDAVNRARPTGAKGQYLKGLTIASTMGPSIRVDVPAVLAAAAA